MSVPRAIVVVLLAAATLLLTAVAIQTWSIGIHLPAGPDQVQNLPEPTVPWVLAVSTTVGAVTTGVTAWLVARARPSRRNADNAHES